LTINNCMGDTKVSDLPEITTLADNDILYISVIGTGSTSNKITYNNFKTPLYNLVGEVQTNINSLSARFDTIVSELESQQVDYTQEILDLTTSNLFLSSTLESVSGVAYQQRDTIDEIYDYFSYGFSGSVNINGTILTFLSGSLQTVTS